MDIAALKKAVKQSRSLAEVARRIGTDITGGRRHKELKDVIVQHDIDCSHFCGHGWNRGLDRTMHPSIEKQARLTEMPSEKVFCRESQYKGARQVLVKRLMRDCGFIYECSACRISEWNDNPLVLQLDHINGIKRDNRIENLRFLCPNCHSQTDTFAGKNVRRKAG